MEKQKKYTEIVMKFFSLRHTQFSWVYTRDSEAAQASESTIAELHVWW